MNILFYTSFKVSPTKGGTERTTISAATGLTKHYGCKCYSLYGVDEDTPKEPCFEAELCWTKNNGTDQLTGFIREHQIDWIIDQGAFGLVESFQKACRGTNCQVVLAHHFEPGWEEHFLRWCDVVENFRNAKTLNKRIKQAIKLLFFPYFRMRYLHQLPRHYRNAYLKADRIVLLSSGFIPQFMRYAHLDSADKFQIVPNGLSYDEYLPIERIGQKKPVALIVSRLDDPQKRISLALKIWNEVKRRPEAQDWQLNIVGHGRDEKKYRRMIQQLDIPDVHLLGRQQPKPYYEEASIFLMTSRSEGWGLTLTEAQQFGVVPIAFDSYAALWDIITDEENGLIVPECNVDEYVERLVRLMSDKARRERLAANGLRICQRFSQEEIAKRWWSIISPGSLSQELLSQK